MSAQWKTHAAAFEPMFANRLEEVMHIEQRAYAHPWSRANFLDALHSGYEAQLLVRDGEMLGYFVAMKGVDEVHLLNITVSPDVQRQGWAHYMLNALDHWARSQGALWIWLEVRAGNFRAKRVYERHGYRQVGERRQYYPSSSGRREDALVMSLKL
jgi:ribosomal-protein-alanine N-acetyltransferase